MMTICCTQVSQCKGQGHICNVKNNDINLNRWLCLVHNLAFYIFVWYYVTHVSCAWPKVKVTFRLQIILEFFYTENDCIYSTILSLYGWTLDKFYAIFFIFHPFGMTEILIGIMILNLFKQKVWFQVQILCWT